MGVDETKNLSPRQHLRARNTAKKQKLPSKQTLEENESKAVDMFVSKES